FQMFYGMPARILNHEGKAIQGTLGFVGALLKIVRMVQPTHVAVLFDGECENKRKDIDVEYKANRPDYSQMPEEETPFSQMPDVYEALDYLGMAHGETTDCEADDWIAGYVREYGSEMKIVIVSQDSDFFQLITDRVNVLRYRGDKTVMCDVAYIREKLGVEPTQYAEYKSLTGDNADNIRGAEKVGPKTAAALMKEFGSLERMLLQVQEIKTPSVRQSIMKDADRLRKNYQLIALSGAEKLPFSRERMVFEDRGLTTTDVLRGIGLRK
ncbi:MAG: flap endonuclease, partial [Lachnospiraceae bacterium]|nr:flap endonuclease [Lachnospiraceae bacterium]